MGIKGLRELLKRYVPNFEHKVSMSSYSGKKIAVDASLFICSYKMANATMFEETFINMFVTLLEHNIKPLFVFDGTSPEEKKEERKRRQNMRRSQYDKVERLEFDMEKYYETRIVSDELWQLSHRLNRLTLPTRISLTNELHFNADLVDKEIGKMRSRILNVSDTDFKTLHELLYLFGIDSVRAEGEGEVLCAELCKRGLVDAVLTRDTDTLASCVPEMLCDINTSEKEFTVIRTEEILSTLQLDQASWLDLCIMCGTDYNNNIPRIGPIKAYSYIQEHRSLEELSRHLNVDILKYETTRKLFQCACPYTDEQLFQTGFINLAEIERTIKERRLKVSFSHIQARLSANTATKPNEPM